MIKLTSPQRLIITFAILFLTTAAPISLLVYHQIPSSHDSFTHVTRAKAFHSMLALGHFPVRWTGWAFANAGAPLFNHYQVGFYYLNSFLLSLLPFPFSLTFLLTVTITWLLASLSAFLFLRPYGHFPALTGTLLFTLSPYLLSDIFVRGAYPEILAIAFGVLTLSSLRLTFTSPTPRSYLSLSLSLAAQILSHLPTTLIFAPAYFIYFIFTRRTHSQSIHPPFHLYLFSLLTALGLSAFYWLPALAEINQINSAGLTAGHYSYQRHFVSLPDLVIPRWGFGLASSHSPNAMPTQLGLIHWFSIITWFSLLAFSARFRRHAATNTFIILSLIFYSLFLQLPPTQPIWRFLPFLQFIQFPWRFNLILTLTSSLAAASLMRHLPTRLLPSAALIVSLITTLTYLPYTKTHSFIPSTHLPLDKPAHSLSSNNFQVATETAYLPSGISQPPSPHPLITTTPPLSTLTHLSLPHQLSFTLTATASSTVTIQRLYFPGWQALLDHKDYPLTTNSEGLIQIQIPPGKHYLQLRYTNTPLRLVANIASLLSLLLVCAFTATRIAHHHRS